MFEEFYGFSGKPFQLTPDPEFYYRSLTHRKALSYLGYGLAQGEGFIVITGEIGAGKSTLVAHLIASLDPRQVSIGQVVTSNLDAAEVVHVAARSFGLDIAGHDKASALGEIEAFLHEEARAGRRALLVVDEAQNLSVAALEELRMLSNFQLGNQSLLQVLLLGQPEFRGTLQHAPELEQLRQRVIAAHHLEAMQADEIEGYVTHRLGKVGWDGHPAFGEGFFADLFTASAGIPRKINQLANRALLLGAVEERDEIDAEMLAAVLAELEEDQASAPAPAPAAVASMIAGSAHAEAGHGPRLNVDASLVEDLLAERDVQIAILQQSVNDLARQLEEDRAEHLQRDLLAMREQLARLEARTFEQERTIRQTLSMLIEWIEGEMNASKAA